MTSVFENHPHPGSLLIDTFEYSLPEARIAARPLSPRESAKMLCWQKDGTITDRHFADLPQVLPQNSLLVLNESRVLPAKLRFTASLGREVELFCIEPDEFYNSMEQALSQKGYVYWQCIGSGTTKWPAGERLRMGDDNLTLTAEMQGKSGGNFTVLFRWTNNALSFGDVLERFGAIALPPHINRLPDANDRVCYQSIFARNSGSLTAPTAALHLSENLLAHIADKGHHFANSTLHVSADAFEPIAPGPIRQHQMNSEWIEADLPLVESLRKNLNGNIVAVGTTVMRTIESLYWIGCKLAQGIPINWEGDAVAQWEPYDPQYSEVSVADALDALHLCIDNAGAPLRTRTRMMIAPGYKMKLSHALITNFHAPRSTLLPLVAACVGDDWKRIYQHALAHNYRFLSYGDGSYLALR